MRPFAKHIFMFLFSFFGKIHNAVLRRKMHAQFLMVINSEESDENGQRKKGTAASAGIKNAREKKIQKQKHF